MTIIKSIIHICVAAIGAAFAAAAPAYAAKEVLDLQPSSPWNVNYSTDSCVMGREFGEGDEKVFLIFESYAPGEAFKLSLAGKPVKFNDLDGEAAIQFGSAEAEQKYSFTAGTLGKNMPAAFFRNAQISAPSDAQIKQMQSNFPYRLEPVGSAREAAIKVVTIKGAFRKNLILQTNGLAKPLAALRKCTDNLAATWGIDAVKHTSLRRYAAPIKSPATWIVTSDYPEDMLRQGKRSIIQFRLMVDIAGNPTSCHIQQSNRLKAFDDTVCRALMKRARFDPALAEDGTPIASYYINSVFFQLPG
jgi:Gram-negative bacterial TonB protein C-terminal